MNLLIVEDELSLSNMIKKFLKEKFSTIKIKQVSSYIDFLDELHIIKSYDLVIVDIILQWSKDKTGIDIVKYIREKSCSIPIIVISWLWKLCWLEKAFSVWANDYLIKPFRLRELELRVDRWFKLFFYPNLSNYECVNYHALLYNLKENNFYYEKQIIKLTKINKLILSIFISNPERLIRRDFLAWKIWLDNSFIEDRNIRVSILRLKKELNCCGIDSWIQNVRWEWYMFKKI